MKALRGAEGHSLLVKVERHRRGLSGCKLEMFLAPGDRPFAASARTSFFTTSKSVLAPASSGLTTPIAKACRLVQAPMASASSVAPSTVIVSALPRHILHFEASETGWPSAPSLIVLVIAPSSIGFSNRVRRIVTPGFGGESQVAVCDAVQVHRFLGLHSLSRKKRWDLRRAALAFT